MIIICLEGVHGCGKTELIRLLTQQGYNCLDEGFINMPAFSMPPQSFTMESIWASRWLERILKLQKDTEGQARAPRETLYFADRSPFSAVYYASNGHLLETVICHQVKELAELADIRLFTVHIKVEENLLWTRIQERLQREPDRKKYNEDSYAWLTQTINWYEQKAPLWDFTLHNDGNLDEVAQQLLDMLSASVKNIKESLIA